MLALTKDKFLMSLTSDIWDQHSFELLLHSEKLIKVSMLLVGLKKNKKTYKKSSRKKEIIKSLAYVE